jgi:Fic/DOC family
VNPAWGELVWSADHERAAISRAVDRGNLRRLGVGLYTSAAPQDLEKVARKRVWDIVARVFPGAIVVDRSARAGGLGASQELLVVHARRGPFAVPGFSIVPRPGAGPTQGEIPLPNGLFLASEARTMLESLAKPGGKRLDQLAVEEWIDELCSRGGERRINAVRDLARSIAPELRTLGAHRKLERLIAAALSSGDARTAMSPSLIARAGGVPFDRARLDKFSVLVDHLLSVSPGGIVDLAADSPRRVNLPFFEAYFSNFIEGTEFTLNEAEGIVFNNELPAERPADAHDILGTYKLVADQQHMCEVPRSGQELIELLRSRHAEVMRARSDKRPGNFKVLANRAGSSEFVAPDLVEGTLHAGFEVGTSLLDPFQRSVYMMFLVAEIHPFADGNGRVAGIAMNAELVANAQVRIIIPTVLRLHYISALKAATHNDVFAPLVAMLAFAQRYTARVNFATIATAKADLDRTNAFRDPYEAEQAGIRLELP